MCCVCVDELLRIVLINARVLALDSAVSRRVCAVLLSVYVHICEHTQMCTYIHRGWRMPSLHVGILQLSPHVPEVTE